jgi:hypothetical protein
MVNKCAAYGCKSGYKVSKGMDAAAAAAAAAAELKFSCDKWARANPRNDYVNVPSITICSLHFRSDDFVEEHKDSITSSG